MVTLAAEPQEVAESSQCPRVKPGLPAVFSQFEKAPNASAATPSTPPMERLPTQVAERVLLKIIIPA
jgi:hypothetical protein